MNKQKKIQATVRQAVSRDGTGQLQMQKNEEKISFSSFFFQNFPLYSYCIWFKIKSISGRKWRKVVRKGECVAADSRKHLK
ncbi:hypothetical protein ACTM9V_04150 [Oliverpabstia intestinalis]|uniref:hypothetical protein n=1 Tax=Oliverpabstia intestinalis TaxID=2606633 RepID=UPI003F8A1B64